MGIDIHTSLERNVNGSWIQIARDIEQDRNYLLFEALSGTSSREPKLKLEPIAQYRGFPDDVTIETKEMINEFSDFGESWVGLDELIMTKDKYRTFILEEYVDKKLLETKGIPVIIDNVHDKNIILHRWEEKSDYFIEFINNICIAILEYLNKEKSTENTIFNISDPENYRVIFWFDN